MLEISEIDPADRADAAEGDRHVCRECGDEYEIECKRCKTYEIFVELDYDQRYLMKEFLEKYK